MTARTVGTEVALLGHHQDREGSRRAQRRGDRRRARSKVKAASSFRRPGSCPAIAEFATANGIVFIADEIQSGFCRTGDWFASSYDGVVPDMITTAKGIAGGMPLAAVTGRAELMDTVHAGGLGGTYGGNPVACAGALGSIQWMKDNDACGLAREIESIMVPRLRAMQENFPQIGDVRGRGAMLAIELIEPGTMNPQCIARRLS